MKNKKKSYKKWIALDTKNYLKKKNIIQENMQKIDIMICLKKKNKKKDRKKHQIPGNSQEEFAKTIRTNNITNEKNLRNINSYES